MIPTPLSPLELAAGHPLGLEPERPGDWPEVREPPLEVLRQLLGDALRRGPVAVAFSGGRDSSALLAVAVDTARREGLPLPIPVTLRFSQDGDHHEDEWQELVIAHLGLPGWERIELTDEMDVIGPYARPGLLKHGPMFPANAHIVVPILKRLPGTTVVTGFDGDGLFGGHRWQPLSRLRDPGIVSRRTARRTALAAAPRALKREWGARRWGLAVPWLKPDAAREFSRALGATSAAEPVRWAPRVRWYGRARVVRLAAHTLALLATDGGGECLSPFAEPRLLAAVARDACGLGYRSREVAMAHLFGALLPPALLSRSTKATFDSAFRSSATQEFAAQWRGDGLDPALVDEGLLRQQWRAGDMFGLAGLTVQDAWLASGHH